MKYLDILIEKTEGAIKNGKSQKKTNKTNTSQKTKTMSETDATKTRMWTQVLLKSSKVRQLGFLHIFLFKSVVITSVNTARHRNV